jgi:hypothetical protein
MPVSSAEVEPAVIRVTDDGGATRTDPGLAHLLEGPQSPSGRVRGWFVVLQAGGWASAADQVVAAELFVPFSARVGAMSFA